MSARFAGLAFFALVAVVSASPVPCDTVTVTDWSPLPTISIPGGPSDPITSVPLPTSISIPGLPPIDPTSTELPTPTDTWVPPVIPTVPSVSVPTISIPTVSIPSISIPSISVPTISVPSVSLPTVSVPPISVPTISVPPISVPSISVPSISVPTISVPSISVPSVPVPTISVPTITLPSVTLPTITLPTGSSGNAPTDTSSAPSTTSTSAPSSGDGNGNGNGGGVCNTGSIHCCNTIAQSGTSKGQKDILDAVSSLGSAVSGSLLTGLLGVLGSGVNAAVGLNCSPISVIGVVGSSSCNAHPVCCEDNAKGGLISIGCIPITL